MATTQKNRLVSITTPLGKDALLLRHMAGDEAMSQPFRWNLDLVSEKGDLDPDKILGRELTLEFKMPSGENRYFHGVVTEFSQAGWQQRHFEYFVTVRPWFWLLSRTADCRIYQEKTVPQIFEELVKQYGFTHYELRLSGQYEPWDYCVQYRETDFNFLSRLLEQEGIYYFFEHLKDKHTMVLADDAQAHHTLKDYESVPFYPPGAPDDRRKRDHLKSWTFTKSVLSGNYATTDFDFEKPRNSLAGSAGITRPHEKADYEIFDYPAELTKLDSNQSNLTAKIRIEELQSNYMQARGAGDAAGLATGLHFKLTQYPRDDLNIDYLITKASYSLNSGAHEGGGDDSNDEFSISIEVIDFKNPFRALRTTPKPVVQGAQTAIVVGKSGDEIYTDKYGRIKVQFHWDRYGKKDENSSCWMRVAQLWAGKTWGGIQVPRIGQEVIVSFLEGDPDQPIITGRVYNGDSMPPYELPANATQSGIKSRSSKDGTGANFNEFRFEDKKGAEQVFLHAEKNQDIEVENDETHWVGHDRSKSIDHDEKVNVGHDRTETVSHDEKITIGNDQTIAIGGNRTISVAKSETATVALQRTHAVGINETIAVGAAQEINVGAAQTVTVGAAQAITVGANQSTNVGASQSISVGSSQSTEIGKSQSVKVGEAQSTDVGKSMTLNVGKELSITAADAITITTGSASISMKKDGTISIKGKDVTVEGSGKISIKASSDITMKGSKIVQN